MSRHRAPRHPATTATAEQDREAEQVLVRDCMRDHVFAYHIAARPTPTRERTFPYVLDDVAWARRHGYGDTAAAADQ